MKDYFSIQYTSFDESQEKDISSFLSKFTKIKEYTSDEYFYAFENKQGEYVSFGLYRGKFVFKIDNKKTLKLINEKYDIQNKLFSYYTDMIFHGIVKDENLYIFSVIYLENEFCPGLFEIVNLTSILGLDFVPVIFTKIKFNDMIEKNMILTQRSGIGFKSKVFIST